MKGRVLFIIVICSLLGLGLAGCSDDDSPLVPQAGTINIVIEDGRALDWVLSGPGDYEIRGNGSRVLESPGPGRYTIVWEARPGWVTRPLETKTLGLDGPIYFYGSQHLQQIHTATDAVVRFQTAYHESDFELFETILSQDFIFIQTDRDTYDLDAELALTSKMFSGLEGNDGLVISDINVGLFQPMDAWGAIAENDPDFGYSTGILSRPYAVMIDFVVQGQGLILRSTGMTTFYAINEGSMQVPIYKIIGIKDDTEAGKAIEMVTWTMLKAQFD